MSGFTSPTSPTLTLPAAVIESWPKHRSTGNSRAERRMLARRLLQRDTARRLDTARAWSHRSFSATRTATLILTLGTATVAAAVVTFSTTGFGF